ncbi:PREDICTED: protein Shroom1 isoform X1 [Condylura cristata]|uniref:protein Shroom1 isoform X1 n=1 Tax=Condylura cristata TaxID=143302 RepID=UPI000642E891|nr:PREDICTED: protein Shroom1 isoform X1 [Condylura cristata]
MEALGPGSHSASPASSTRSPDLRRLSNRADSAYSSFSAASGGPEPRTLSPGTDLLPYLDWDYVRVVWGGPAAAEPTVALRTSPEPRPAAAACTGPRPPQVQGTPGPLSRQATPLLYALAAEAEAAARAAEPPSPPASRAAYRQRLQGAQRRVLRETSFQRKELRMSLPVRLRLGATARPPSVLPRSASLSHPGCGCEAEPAHPGSPAPTTSDRGCLDDQRGCLDDQQRKWCFSEPGKLDHVGWGSGLSGKYSAELGSSSGLPRLEPQELQRCTLAEVRWLRGSQRGGTEDPEPGSSKLGVAYRLATRSRRASEEMLGFCGDQGGAMAVSQVWQAVPYGAESSRPPLFQTRLSRFPTQKEVAVVCPTKGSHNSSPRYEKRGSDPCVASARLPSLPDDDVFLEEAPLVSVTSPSVSHDPLGLPTSVHAPPQEYRAGLGQRADRATTSPEYSFHKCPETAGAGDCWHEVPGSVDVSSPTCCSSPGTANGDLPTIDSSGLLNTDPSAASGSDPLKPLPMDALKPPGSDTPGSPDHSALAWGIDQPASRSTWPSPRLEELIQELARLDPSLSDTLTSYPSPEPPVALIDGLIPIAEVWAAMRSVCGEAGENAAGTSEPGSTQLLPTSQKESRPESLSTHPVPDIPRGHALPEPNNSIQAKKVELASLLQKMLEDLQGEQERLREVAQAWARRGTALEAAVGQACAPRELERFSRFMADLERVLGLLLLLGTRLARVCSALNRAGADRDPDEQASLLQRLRLLQRQQEDAKELKEHVARRERALREVLAQTLPARELRAYCTLLAGKAAVLAQQRSLDDRVRHLQDQLDAVKSGLGQRLSPPLPRGPAWVPGIGPRHKEPFPSPLN